MAKDIRITAGSVVVEAELNDTQTAGAIWDVLPIEERGSTWGDEIYFSVPVESPLEADARQVVEPGTLCFWVEGHALAIPFGPTPASVGDECRLVTRVNLLGICLGDPKVLGSIKEGDTIRVARA